MNANFERYQRGHRQDLESPSNQRLNAGSTRPRRENVRFGVNKGKHSKNNLVIDEHIQEATPEHLRIEIDKIIDGFLANPDKSEYIFPADYNNLQRKYVHYKAQIMNLISRSHGKEPNRQLHLTKKPKLLSSQSFQVPVCDEIYAQLQIFDKQFRGHAPQPYRNWSIKRVETNYDLIQESKPIIPRPPTDRPAIRTIRENLPIFEKRRNILDCIESNRVIILSSETGSGKTTQVPQYIMEEASLRKQPCKIICTQPRRISTVAAAERVSYERDELVGASVGYHIRLESNYSFNTNLLFCTVGIFLRNIMDGSDCLGNITHVIVDEIHERDKLSDFLLICLKQNLSRYPHLKIILMSATMDTTKFQEYFQSSTVLSIPGRLFPIETFFIEEILGMTQFVTPQMRAAMKKLEERNPLQPIDTVVGAGVVEQVAPLSDMDQAHFDDVLETYMNLSDNYNYTEDFTEATADLMHVFLSEHVSVDQQHSGTGWTALAVACHLGDLQFVNILCNLGASLDIADQMGQTPYDYAKISKRKEILLFLDDVKERRKLDKNSLKSNDPEYLRQLYDMTTPDEFIDYDLIVELIKYIDSRSNAGSILIFLPGYDEIMQCNDHIVDSNLNSSKYRVFFLHSSMNMKDQWDVFKPLANQRKLILSTNIAETSITVEDVVFVIDVGKAKEKVYDSYNKLSSLQSQWISRACAKQRQGRAGRVMPGFCFRMYSKQRFTYMSEERIPEILRVSLEELCLHAKIIAPNHMNIYNFLALALDPPSANSVGVAIEHLQGLGALDKEEELTRLGEYLTHLPLEPRLGKMLLLGCIFKCLEPMLTICASMAHKDPFQLPPQANLRTAAAAKRRELLNGVAGDHAIYLLVFQRWQDEMTKGRSRQFCHEYFISESAMNSVLDTRRQLLSQLRAIGFVNCSRSLDDLNHNSNSWGLVKGIMCAAYFPNVAYPFQRGVALATRNEKKVAIHNTSVCCAKRYDHWYFYDEMVKNRSNFLIRGVTICSPLMVAVMCGVNSVYPSSHSVSLDDWVEFYFGDTLIIKLRQALHSLVDSVVLNPRHPIESSGVILNTLRSVLDKEEKNCGFVQPPNVGQRPKFLFRTVNSESASAPITRNGMRPNASESQNQNGKVCRREDPIEADKKPKPYIPPNKRKNFENSKVFEGRRPNTSDLAQSLQELNVNDPPSSANSLLRGLTVGAEGPVPQFNNSNRFHQTQSQKNKPQQRFHGHNANFGIGQFNSEFSAPGRSGSGKSGRRNRRGKRHF
ncbi:3'-5' RNA helicase YTHDC2-like isoform X1 [Euwallacea fornicatus]|uniref:3'-5' RNA helicase YTHDC2-like isoform X1 n=1 Tax=Euwallacea fornicatus TaxID=995702 RepID=UPI00338DB662